jgi:hypothetical protein
MKQETVNWKAAYEDSLIMQRASNAGYESKIFELNQKIEKMYSEEEVKKLITDFLFARGLGREVQNVNTWFEQFKKK